MALFFRTPSHLTCLKDGGDTLFRDLMSRPPAVFSSSVDADVYTLLTSCGVSLQLKPRSQMPYRGWKTVNRIYIISPEKEMLKFGESLNS